MPEFALGDLVGFPVAPNTVRTISGYVEAISTDQRTGLTVISWRTVQTGDLIRSRADAIERLKTW